MAMSSVKPVMIVGVDDSDISFYALKWTLERFFVPFGSNSPFKLLIVNAKPCAASASAVALGPSFGGSTEVYKCVDSDFKKIAARVVNKAKEMCASKSVTDVVAEVHEGDTRTVLCHAVDKHNASLLVVGSHGYGAIKRAFLGSVGDYCVHHAHCSVMIVKKPKTKN